MGHTPPETRNQTQNKNLYATTWQKHVNGTRKEDPVLRPGTQPTHVWPCYLGQHVKSYKKDPTTEDSEQGCPTNSSSQISICNL